MTTMITETELNSKAAEPRPAIALTRAFALGDWLVLPELNRIQLRNNSAHRQLEPRLIKLLCFLAANADRVLSREELVQELWPKVVVNENSLTRAVSELRKQLQSPGSTSSNYIETIPKRGYRLIPQIDIADRKRLTTKPQRANNWDNIASLSPRGYAVALSAACLSLVVAAWLVLSPAKLLDSGGDPVFLSDEILKTPMDFLGGKLLLSNTNTNTNTNAGAVVVNSISAPVVSLDKKQYAFIQYDNQGSTIFLGCLGSAIEPEPVYFSERQVFNLAWSPIGNNLLFAMKPTMATAAIYSSISETAELVLLNLNTLEAHRLMEDTSPRDNNAGSSLNLT
jgi:DNA-binding winged helix-turn-helix (wHTH) protein